MATVRRSRLKFLYFTIAFVFLNLFLTGLDIIHPLWRPSNFIHLLPPDHCASLPCDTLIFGRPVVLTEEDRTPLSVPDGVEIYVNYTVGRLGLKKLLGGNLNDVTSFRYSINAESQCRASDGLLKVVVVVVSAPGHFDRRQLVRRTWAGRLGDTSWGRHVFLTGRTANETLQSRLEEESGQFGDIVQLDMMDSYEILTAKSVALLHWAQQFCSAKVPFVLKCDDDVYVNTGRLHSAVTAITKTIPYYEAGVYGTQIVIDNPPQRKLESKHYVSMELWPWPAYPSYLYGGCYLLGRKALAPLLTAAQSTPYFPFEDLYLIGLCSRKAHVPLWTFDKMFIMENGNRTGDPCFAGESITWQTRSDGQLLESHQTTKKLEDEISKIKCRGGQSGRGLGNVIHFQLIDPAEYQTWSRNVMSLLPVNHTQPRQT